MSKSINPGGSTLAKTRRTDTAARTAEALQLRISGLTYDQIAERLDYSDKSGPWRAVEGELNRIRQERASEVVSLDLARLDKLLNAVWSKAMAGDPSAIDRVLKVLDRRAKYFGLDGHAESTFDELRAAHELTYADTLSRIAHIRDTIDGRLLIAITNEMSRASKGLPTPEIPWEDASQRLDSFRDQQGDE